ncbi:MAG: MBL fold metallo-hydrolase [Rhodospirillaceae bacterium]|jgi:L-ascorbate metabolism protein UlaG (beta-lactamase superfamily)|nr:MBL fold metallo-hydrolase [Rhodospirillales bacterium]MBT3906578.1 MBL fold metallo-hydrolase [Rhodospirillaceae bacterium]MBT4700922.1 MBL fold metallo-hydrolase [Rhodospirillaceae bacterium]MBT5033178.1 MBL fold metallo-hydrolase [Rhodospirillaceae bacterium]MBT6219051.1 MBL fold metallo-hydrolase [Rhodospirillaceae bacterium]
MHTAKGFFIAMAIFTIWTLGTAPATAADRACTFGFVEGPSLFQPAAFQLASVPKGNVKITFIGHSTFVLESPAGITLATDFNGIHTPKIPPTIVTMNNSHSSHYTDVFSPKTSFVLRGWDPNGGIAKHDIKTKDMRVYNVPTNVERFSDRLTNKNSIFVIETNGLCFAHMGHLHHVIGSKQSRALGRTDVLFIPIDGLMTMSFEEVMLSIKKISPKLVIPMHFFSETDSHSFLQFLNKKFPVKTTKQTSVLINRRSLPKTTEILLLNAEFWSGVAGED